jgi:hypothetical protein
MSEMESVVSSHNIAVSATIIVPAFHKVARFDDCRLNRSVAEDLQCKEESYLLR